jgi:AcrR family transcriptional regulator
MPALDRNRGPADQPLRDRIVTAAEAICLREGVARMSMRKVAGAVGVSAAAIYRYFENKQALLNEVVTVGLRSLESYLRTALEAETAYTRLRQLCERFLDFALEKPEHFDLAFLVSGTDRAHIERKGGRGLEGTFRLAIDQISQCMERGELKRDDPLSTAVLIWGHAYGLIMLYRTGGLGDDVEAFRLVYGDSLDRLLTGLRPLRAGRDIRRPI